MRSAASMYYKQLWKRPLESSPEWGAFPLATHDSCFKWPIILVDLNALEFLLWMMLEEEFSCKKNRIGVQSLKKLIKSSWNLEGNTARLRSSAMEEYLARLRGVVRAKGDDNEWIQSFFFVQTHGSSCRGRADMCFYAFSFCALTQCGTVLIRHSPSA